MASIVTSFAGMPVQTERTPCPHHSGQDVTLRIGNHTIFLSREEAIRLAADLLDATQTAEGQA